LRASRRGIAGSLVEADRIDVGDGDEPEGQSGEDEEEEGREDQGQAGEAADGLGLRRVRRAAREVAGLFDEKKAADQVEGAERDADAEEEGRRS
jgi:hypothetical protein